MTTAPRIFLTISITAFALSFTSVGSDFGWGILKPLSAVTLIGFFITNLFAKDMALHDHEEMARRGLARPGEALHKGFIPGRACTQGHPVFGRSEDGGRQLANATIYQQFL